MSKLLGRLRSPATVFYEYAADDGALLKEAADRIEAFEARVRELKTSLRTITFARYSDLTMADVERIALAALVAANAEEVADSA